MEADDHAGREMPRYKCHKMVWALKIAEIVPIRGAPNQESDGSAIITPAEDGFGPFRVDYSYMSKHKPQVGGYYVVYEDGYESYSPAGAFKAGYTLIVEPSGSSVEGGGPPPPTASGLDGVKGGDPEPPTE